MRHRKLALAASTALIGATPATADTPLHREYQRAYRDVQRRLGHRAPGRNILRWGLRSGRRAPAQIVARSLAVLHRMLAPALVVPAGSTVSATPAPAPAPSSTALASAGGGGSGLVGCIISRESGGSSTVVNSSGHMGLGQWDEATWLADGGGRYASTPLGASAAQQTAVIQQQVAAGNTGQWTQFDGC